MDTSPTLQFAYCLVISPTGQCLVTIGLLCEYIFMYIGYGQRYMYTWLYHHHHHLARAACLPHGLYVLLALIFFFIFKISIKYLISVSSRPIFTSFHHMISILS